MKLGLRVISKVEGRASLSARPSSFDLGSVFWSLLCVYLPLEEAWPVYWEGVNIDTRIS